MYYILFTLTLHVHTTVHTLYILFKHSYTCTYCYITVCALLFIHTSTLHYTTTYILIPYYCTCIVHSYTVQLYMFTHLSCLHIYLHTNSYHCIHLLYVHTLCGWLQKGPLNFNLTANNTCPKAWWIDDYRGALSKLDLLLFILQIIRLLSFLLTSLTSEKHISYISRTRDC